MASCIWSGLSRFLFDRFFPLGLPKINSSAEFFRLFFAVRAPPAGAAAPDLLRGCVPARDARERNRPPGPRFNAGGISLHQLLSPRPSGAGASREGDRRAASPRSRPRAFVSLPLNSPLGDRSLEICAHRVRASRGAPLFQSARSLRRSASPGRESCAACKTSKGREVSIYPRSSPELICRSYEIVQYFRKNQQRQAAHRKELPILREPIER